MGQYVRECLVLSEWHASLISGRVVCGPRCGEHSCVGFRVMQEACGGVASPSFVSVELGLRPERVTRDSAASVRGEEVYRGTRRA